MANEELKTAAIEAVTKSKTPVLTIRHSPVEPKALSVMKNQFYTVHVTVSLTTVISLQ